MKKIFLLHALFITIAGIFISCNKERSCETCTDGSPFYNHPPVANAGVDQTITLPTNNVNLDGSASTDPENNITNYEWKKIYGPVPYIMNNSFISQTSVTNLTEGVYHFELKVTDAGGLYSKDTVEINVDQPNNRDTITVYNLHWDALNECTINIDNVLNSLPLGSTFDVYLKVENLDGTWSSWVALPQGPLPTSGLYYYDVVGSRLRIMVAYGYDCSMEPLYEHIVRIVLH